MSDWIDVINDTSPQPAPIADIAPRNDAVGDGVTVSLQPKILEICTNFAEQVLPTIARQLQGRNQTNTPVILGQIVTGKMAEFGVWALLHERGITSAMPDVKIYTKEKKSWAPDLHLSQPPHSAIHVKSMSRAQMEALGLSFTIQFSGSGSGHTDREILSANANQYLALALVDGIQVTITGLMSCGLIGNALKLRDPISQRLLGIKKVIYNYDVQNLTPDERWGFFKGKST